MRSTEQSTWIETKKAALEHFLVTAKTSKQIAQRIAQGDASASRT